MKQTIIAVVVGLLLAFAAAMVMRSVHAAPLRVECVDEMCIVPKAVLVDLDQRAAQAEHYAQLCGWAQAPTKEATPK